MAMATHEPLHSLSSASTEAAPPPSKPTSSVKILAESPDLKSIPSKYAHFINGYNNGDSTTEASSDPPQASIPVIDLSLLDSVSPHQRLKFIHDLGRACQDWGFFMVVNHGVPETLMKKMMEVTEDFFKLPEEEKMKLEPKNILDPIQCGTSFNAIKEEVFFWRDFLKVFVHPQFHSPVKPENFSEVLMEYSKKTREIVSKLLERISESLGLEPEDIKNELQLESSLQIFTVNYYPPCPQPELAVGLPPHSDHGLLTLLLPNEVGGLQIQHKGKWINADPLPYSFLFNTADQLEIFSNGRYKSLLHRATLNNEKTRISLVMTNGPSPEATVKPASKLVNIDNDDNSSFPKYTAMKYMEYMELQQCNKLDGKSCLDRVKIYTD